MKIFKLLVDSLFWAFLLQIFLFLVDAASARNFGARTYNFLGFFLLYLYTILMVAVIRGLAPAKK